MSEHDEQAALIEWANYQANTCPELDMLFAVPNGGHRAKRTAAMMKAEGVKPGVPDLWLPVKRQGFTGLVIEMKYGKNKPSDWQRWWLESLKAQNWQTAVCYSFDEARQTILNYLEG